MLDEIIENLNDTQREAVLHTEGPLLVLAGAGSGKTRVLTVRVAYLLSLGIAPWRIMAITFTNRAANEMKNRLGQMVPDRAGDLWVTTFHAACLRILRRDAGRLGFARDFAVFDSSDQQTLIRDCLNELSVATARFTPQAIHAAISRAKNELLDPDALESRAGDIFEATAARVFGLYQQKLQNLGAMDFDDLLQKTVQLFRENRDVLEYYQERFLHLLVDEYQDTNRAQYVLVGYLAGLHGNLCVVGDPDQCIYGWRGADLNNILNFERDYPRARVIRLERNYRSTKHILDAANRVIEHNERRKEKVLWTDGLPGNPVMVFEAGSEKDEAQFVAGQIRALAKPGERSYRDFAVLYRTHAQSRPVEEALMTAGIPYVIVGGLRFYERKEIKDVLAYLRVVANPYDAVSLERVVNVPKRGIGPAYYSQLLAVAREQSIPPAGALGLAGEVAGLPAKVKEAAVRLGGLITEWHAWTLGLTALVDDILARTGYWSQLAAEDTVEARTRMENLKELSTVTTAYDVKWGGDWNLADFLADIALMTDADRYDENSDAVTLMSLHSAKGLEFPVVFLTGLEERLFPHSRTVDKREELEEERRLCYVGITRAREELYLTHCQARSLYGSTMRNAPSRFLKEIGPQLLQPFGGGRQRPGSRAATPPVSGEVHQFQAGDRVVHRIWGQGQITRIEGSGLSAEVEVDFPHLGKKVLLLQYAPLKPADGSGG
ncbi:MAG TPA: UvrD-helicase domain-containing protein [Spirochaetia bacterium]|nr:UvrD-helicase domain-containing protein [Spirochaetia bacterium]